MKHIAQYVKSPIIDPGKGIGRIVALNNATPQVITVRWMATGRFGTYYDDQLTVLCPTCAGQPGFDDDQLERLRKECEACKPK